MESDKTLWKHAQEISIARADIKSWLLEDNWDF